MNDSDRYPYIALTPHEHLHMVRTIAMARLRLHACGLRPLGDRRRMLDMPRVYFNRVEWERCRCVDCRPRMYLHPAPLTCEHCGAIAVFWNQYNHCEQCHACGTRSDGYDDLPF